MSVFDPGDVVRYRGSFEGFTSLSFTGVADGAVGIVLSEIVDDNHCIISNIEPDEDLARCRTRYYRVQFAQGSIEFVSDLDIEALGEFD